MGVDQAGRDGPAAEVGDLGSGRRGRPRGLAGSDRDEPAVLDRHGFGPGSRGIRRVHVGVVKDPPGHALLLGLDEAASGYRSPAFGAARANNDSSS